MANTPFLSTQPAQDEGMPNFLWRIATYLWGGFTGRFPLSTGTKVNSWATATITIKGGSGYTPLPAYVCSRVILSNATGVTIDVLSLNAALGFAPLANGAVVSIPVVANASEIQVRRDDQAAGTVTAGAIYQA